MKQAHKLTALLLSLLLLSATASCSAKDAETSVDTTTPAVITDTTGAETTAFDPFATLPGDVSYDDYEFRFLNGNSGSWYTRTSVVSEEMNGEPINDAIYTRNLRVEEQFNVQIMETTTNDIAADTRNIIQAGTDDFDISLVNLMGVYALAQENLFINFYDIPNLNLDAAWWDQNAVNDMSVCNKLYFCMSDFDITRFDGIRSLYFNKELIEMYSLENPYDLVDGNKWTLDKYIEMAAAVTSDLDGDGVMTDTDRYGIVSYDEIVIDMLTYATGLKYIGKNANDELTLTLNSEKYYDVYEKIRTVLFEDNLLFDARRKSAYLRGLGDRIQEQMFLENGALFYSECMAWTRVLREMEADFGVLPPPKYDEAQERYYSVIINPWVMTIPATAKDTGRTGLILEALAAASHDTVVTAYYDITLTGKVARDPDTIRMLELVFANLAYNIHVTDINLRSGTMSKLQANTANIASYFASSEKAFNKILPKVNEKFENLK